MHNRWNIRRISLWTFFLMQIVLVVLYFSTQIEDSATAILHNQDENAIVFISTRSNTNGTKHKQTYYNERNTVILTSRYVEDLYADFNTSLCYKSGTDLNSMKRRKDANWKCLCSPDWHGNDCGQPEVIWRALLASKKPRSISGPRKIQRRLIYFIEIDENSADFIEITILEMKHVTDLFILYDVNANSRIQTKLNSGFLKHVYNKILYINGASRSVAWRKAKRVIRNLREDDIFFINNPYEIPNIRALMFLKLYDQWPQPLTFRLRWSVYGFFWTHPQKTSLTTGACTINYLYEALEDNLDHFNYKFISNENPKAKQGLIVGDLNHFGGWFCEFCAEPSTILKLLEHNHVNNTTILEKLVRKKIDVAYVEDLIENGLYIDGKMELKRAHRYNEHYYAPIFVNNNSWKFDWLLTNLYSKMDYY